MNDGVWVFGTNIKPLVLLISLAVTEHVTGLEDDHSFGGLIVFTLVY